MFFCGCTYNLQSQKNTLLAQYITTLHRVYYITQQQPNDILTYFNLLILWNCNFNSHNFKNSCNLMRHKFLKLAEDNAEMSKHVRVSKYLHILHSSTYIC
jgi:hypothetical protein